MGYRSSVTAIIYSIKLGDHDEAYNRLKLLMNTAFKDVYNYWQDPHFTWHDKRHILKFSVDDVKWYDSYPEVERFMAFLNEVQELGYEWEFVRIGENYVDIDTDSSGDSQSFLSVVREVAF